MYIVTVQDVICLLLILVYAYDGGRNAIGQLKIGDSSFGRFQLQYVSKNAFFPLNNSEKLTDFKTCYMTN